MNLSEFRERIKFSECSGIISTVDNNIKITLNDFGVYEEEIVDPTKFDAEKICKVSPNFNVETDESEIARNIFKNIKNIKYDAKLGYYLNTYIGYVVEGDYRMHASSGGFGTWIFAELFKNDLIDGVIHVKQNQASNSKILFKYDISRSIDEIKSGSKTKYYPVEMSEVLRIVKDNPGRYAIIGIPSFIMAIRLLQEYDEVFKERIKFTIGLICGHQKSSRFADFMAWQVGIKPENLVSIDFRHKLLDRPAGHYAVKMTGIVDGQLRTTVKPISNLLGQDWGQGYFKVFASDYTDDVMNETADITLGDAWLKEYAKDPKGNNVVIVRNPIINNLLENALIEGRIKLDRVSVDKINQSQSSHFRHTQEELSYRLYKRDKTKEWRPKKRVKASISISPERQAIQDLREEISILSHQIFKEAVERNDLDFFINKMNKLSNKYTKLYCEVRFNNSNIVGKAKIIIKAILKPILNMIRN